MYYLLFGFEILFGFDNKKDMMYKKYFNSIDQDRLGCCVITFYLVNADLTHGLNNKQLIIKKLEAIFDLHRMFCVHIKYKKKDLQQDRQQYYQVIMSKNIYIFRYSISERTALKV